MTSFELASVWGEPGSNHSLAPDTATTSFGIDALLHDSQLLIGREATDVAPGVEVADWLAIRRFCAAVGDPNPLFKDPAYGVATAYNSMIAPSTFIYAVRTPNSGAAYVQRDYNCAPFFVHGAAEWVDVIRVGDRLQSSVRISNVREAPAQDDGRQTCEVVSAVTYRNAYGGLIGNATGTVSLYPYRRGSEMILQREIHEYSDEEIQRIEADLEAESLPRGKLVRYWTDVSVGDVLPRLVKGPVTLADMMAWVIAEAKDLTLGPVAHRDLIARYPGRIRVNPSTGWPYWDANMEFEDILSCVNLGFKMPITRGQQRVALAGQLCTHWMGDDAFLRRLEVDVLGHWCYGDAMWLSAVVAGKRTELVGPRTYHAADLAISGVNQLNETILRGTATVYLPIPGQPVFLPIPH